MVKKYPIGIQDFRSLIQDGYYYVDKTALIHRLVNNGKYFFLSRPRRFGKSLMLSTLAYYFKGDKELFEGLAISNLENSWKKHPVFHMSFARFNAQKESNLENILEFYLADWEKEYGLQKNGLNYENRFASIIKNAAEKTGEKAVILIDEYDSALVSTLENEKIHNDAKELMKAFYTVIKDLDSHIRFAMITGITRFSKLTIFSGLNNLNDISLDQAYSSICGITSEELEKYFQKGIKDLGERFQLDPSSTLLKLKEYYDGYHFSEESAGIYNPFSLFHALEKQKLRNYWFSTGIPSLIAERMRHKDLDLEKYLNPMASDFTLKETDSAYMSDTALLFQYGFLTIKAYDFANDLYTLGIPNREVKEGMSRLLMEKFLYQDVNEGENRIFEISKTVKEGEPEKLMQMIQSFFAGIPFDMSKGSKEVYFHNAFFILLNLLGLKVEAEKHVAGGSIDILLTTADYVYVIEIKLDKPARVALEQINSKDYALAWQAQDRKIFKIGVGFSSERRTIEEWIIE